MSEWTNFLGSQGATISDGDVTAFTTDSDRETLLIPLLSQGMLAVEGAKAKAFLQGQVTCDLDQLSPALSLPGAQCNPKGRMHCSFQLIERHADNLMMVMAADLVEETAASLQKYAVFFQTTLSNASADHAVIGLVGPQCGEAIEAVFGAQPEQDNGVWQSPEGIAIKLGEHCFLVLTQIEQAEAVWSKLSGFARPAAIAEWHKQMIKLGLGQVRHATRELFIPQMINLQATGGISFRKGCYTGQEVVARMKYLGKLKRRMYRIELSSDTAPAVGVECRLSDGGQSVGNIVTAVSTGPATVEMLAVLTKEAATADSLIIQNQQYQCQPLPLPYPMEEA